MKISKIPKKNVIRAAAALLIVLLLAFAAQRLLQGKAGQPMPVEQARQVVLAEYPGTISSLELQSGRYVAELERDQGLYELQLDASSGEILSIVLLQPAASSAVTPAPQPSSTPSAGSTDPPAASPSPSAGRAFSEEEAVQLALQEVPGEPDDVDTGINASGAFYLVEIKTFDDREAIVQVDAISGNIMSVSWEDQDDGDDDKH
ncbi:PepSY domain-containing protein [Paenibacillus sp. PK3_47]|uniref:PepSY domain-containing protein n=1 Tax=Paenibacillus sp. PK3_47 TaxID=2072642 RepID=UPI00201D9D04|nr:PepSY domain-containing protein [Paenibacillus sp. PK3_47]